MKGVIILMSNAKSWKQVSSKLLKDKIMKKLYHDVPECRLPQQDEDTENSGYLTSAITDIQKKGTDLIAKSQVAYYNSIKEIDKKVEGKAFLYAFLGWLVVIFVSYLIAKATLNSVFFAILITLLIAAVGFVLLGLVVEVVYLQIIKKYEDVLRVIHIDYIASLQNIERQLAEEAQTTKDRYYADVLEAQTQYGTNNGGIVVLADWCCNQLMETILKADHRTFLEHVYARISMKVEYDRAEVNRSVLVPEFSAAGVHFQQKDLSGAAVFVLQENSIYNLSSELPVLVGCTQALCAHICEKMDDVLIKNGYNPDAEFTIENNDNTAVVMITAKNPKFIPFQNM